MAKFKVPTNLAQCGDMLYTTRQRRLVIQKEAEALEAQEKLLREHLINKLPKGKASGIAGKVARVSIYTEPVPIIEDEKKFWGHIHKTKQHDLMQKPRLAKEAVESRWANKEVVPGVGRFNVVKVSVEKVK